MARNVGRHVILSALAPVALASGMLAVAPQDALARSPKPSRAPASESTGYSQAKFACTTGEEWSFGSKIPSSWQSKFAKPFESSKSAVGVLFVADALKIGTAQLEPQVLAEYFVWRSMFELKMAHLAYQGFSSIVARPDSPEIDGIKVAALQCLNKLNRTYPTLVLSAGAVKGMNALAAGGLVPSRREAVYEAAARHALALLAGGGSDSDVSNDISLVQGSGGYEELLQTQLAARKGDEAGVVSHAEQFFKLNPTPSILLKDQVDGVHLLLSQAYYGQGRYDRSAKEFKRVSNASNLLTQALWGQAWSFLMKERYGEAIGAAYNLLVGGLKSTFAPEANLVVSIALNETCNYPEAIQSTHYFKKRYARTYKWLYDWNQKQSSSPSDMYRLTADFLKKRVKVPERIGTEWLRSPVFIANQEEINILIEEQQRTRALTSRVVKETVGSTKWFKVGKDLQNILATVPGNLSARESNLTAKINQDLTMRTKKMLNSLADVYENVQLVEAEVFNTVGEKMITDFNQPDALKDLKKRQGKKKMDDGPVWDWGRYPADVDDEDGKEEFWVDELGFLKADIADNCMVK